MVGDSGKKRVQLVGQPLVNYLLIFLRYALNKDVASFRGLSPLPAQSHPNPAYPRILSARSNIRSDTRNREKRQSIPVIDARQPCN